MSSVPSQSSLAIHHGRGDRADLAEDVYMHQFKINGKMASTATYGNGTRTTVRGRTTNLMPGTPRHERRDISRRSQRVQRAADVHSRQHKRGVLEQARYLDDQLSLWTIDHETIGKMARGGASSLPRAGRVDDPFSSCLVHASTSNLSPWNRVTST